jgi:flagellar hook-associated protein 2
MGSIVSSGVGSGLDIAGLVQQLVQAEGAPKTVRLNAEEAKVQAKLSALGTLRSALATFRDTITTLKDLAKFQGRKVTLSTPDFVQAVAASSAVPGRYAIEVEQLATAHKLQSSGSPAPTTPIGTGTLRIATTTQNFDIVIDSTNNTLAGIAAAINDSAANEKVLATVVTGTTEARLTITARATGTANALTITESGGDAGFVALVNGLTPVQGALDAEVLIDGIEVTSGTNTISGAIAGVEITLVEPNEEDGDTTEITVEYDRAAARKTIDELVKSYNGVVDAIKNVSSYNLETKEGGPLFGDAGLRNIVYQLRRVLTSNVVGLTGPFDMLGEIGITAEFNGKLAVDTADLDAAFAADFDAIGELFATDHVGIAVKLDELLAPYLDSDGVFDSRAAGLKSSIDVINERREVLNKRLATLQARYTKEFNALDSLLSQLQGTSNFLSQQLSRLPGSAPLLRRDR